MRSMQGSHCHVATSHRRDVTKSRRGGQQMQKSTSHHVATSPRRHVATSPRRHVATSRRQLKNLHLIIKCERARKSRASGSVRLEARNFRACNTDFKELLGFLYWFFPYCFDYFLDHRRMFFTLHILFLSFMMF